MINRSVIVVSHGEPIGICADRALVTADRHAFACNGRTARFFAAFENIAESDCSGRIESAFGKIEQQSAVLRGAVRIVKHYAVFVDGRVQDVREGEAAPAVRHLDASGLFLRPSAHSIKSIEPAFLGSDRVIFRIGNAVTGHENTVGHRHGGQHAFLAVLSLFGGHVPRVGEVLESEGGVISRTVVVRNVITHEHILRTRHRCDVRRAYSVMFRKINHTGCRAVIIRGSVEGEITCKCRAARIRKRIRRKIYARQRAVHIKTDKAERCRFRKGVVFYRRKR